MGGSYGVVALQATIVAAGFMGFGYLLTGLMPPRVRMDGAIRWALAFPAVVAYALVMMLIHMASGGAVFSHVWLVRAPTAIAAAGLLVLWLRTSRKRKTGDRREAILIGCLVLVALLVWASPVWRVVPLGATDSDTGWHMGWAAQLMNGHSTPTALITGSVPNYYPWMFHALVALIARFTPGGRAYHALAPLQLMQVSGVALALYGLGRSLGRSKLAGLWVATLGSLSAGFAFGLIGVVNRVARTPKVGGTRGTYNASFGNEVPMVPRDLGYTLFTAYLMLLAFALQERSRTALIMAGGVLGLIGLSSPEFFLTGVALGILLAVLQRGLPRAETAAAVLAPAVAIFLVWLGPVLVSYTRLGGFVNTTTSQGGGLPAGQILMSWGVVSPLALYESVRLLGRSRDADLARYLASIVVASGATVVVAGLIPKFFGGGFEVLGRSSRYWPVFELTLAVVAGIGAADLLGRMAVRHRIAAVSLAGLLLALALPIPVNASLRYPGRSHGPLALSEAVLGDPATLYSALATGGDRQCVVASSKADLGIFSFTGYQFVGYFGSRAHVGNQARIRWRNIYDHIGAEATRRRDSRVVTAGVVDPAAWLDLLHRYRVSFLVVPRSRASSGVFARYPDLNRDLASSLAVLRVGPCLRP